MARSQIIKSTLILDLIVIVLSAFQCMDLLLFAWKARLLHNQAIHFIIMICILINSQYGGIRLHFYPLIAGFALYTVSLSQSGYSKVGVWSYSAGTIVSIVCFMLFGPNQYYHFKTSGVFRSAMTEDSTLFGNRLFIYYPTTLKKEDKKGGAIATTEEVEWAYNGNQQLIGLQRLLPSYIPQSIYSFLSRLTIPQIKKDTPLESLNKVYRSNSKYTPIIFSHGYGQTPTWFSTIMKDLSSQGHIIFCIEHKDNSGLHYYDQDQKTSHYLERITDDKDIEQRIKKRAKEIDSLLGEINFIFKKAVDRPIDSELDHSTLTVMGHGLGATTALYVASQDTRIKRVITLDALINPHMYSLISQIRQPHCSINTQMHWINQLDSWKLMKSIVDKQGQQNSSILCTLKGVGEVCFTDLALIMPLELRVAGLIPSLSKAINGQETMRLIQDTLRSFFILNNMHKGIGSYEQIINELDEKVSGVSFHIK